MHPSISVAVTIVTLLSAAAAAQTTPVADPTLGYDRLFGLGGHSCKQYDDTGRLFLFTEGMPSPGVMSWLQRSDGGMKANVPMPNELAAAMPRIPGCLPGNITLPLSAVTTSTVDRLPIVVQPQHDNLTARSAATAATFSAASA